MVQKILEYALKVKLAHLHKAQKGNNFLQYSKTVTVVRFFHYVFQSQYLFQLGKRSRQFVSFYQYVSFYANVFDLSIILV